MSSAPADGGESAPTSEATQLKELQQIELSILLDVQAVCDELSIEFFLGEGTLLGAVRHQGFIPWDDDIDLVMRRSEYERFLALAPPLLAPQYRVQHASTVENYWSPVIKVRLVKGEQKFRQAHIAHLTSDNGPLIDIFPLEYVPRPDGLGLWLQSTYIRLLRNTLVQKLGTKPAATLPRKLMRAIGRAMSTDFIHRQLEWAFTRQHSDRRQPYLGLLASYRTLARQIVPASAFDEAVQLPFEGHDMPVPKEFDMVLTTCYGDYMTLPPEADRVVQHEFVLHETAWQEN